MIPNLIIGGAAANKLRSSSGGISDDAASGLTLLGHEVRTISDAAFYVDSTYRMIPWNTSWIQTGTALFNGSDDTRFDMPTGSSYCVVSAKFRVGDFDTNYVAITIAKNGTVDNSLLHKMYGQGWHPTGGTWIIPVTSGDYIQIQTGTDDTSNQYATLGRESFIDVRVY